MLHGRAGGIGDNVFCIVKTILVSDVPETTPHLMHVPGTGRFSTGKMSPTETLRRISSREGQNTKPLLVFRTSESLHQCVESAEIICDEAIILCM